MGALVSILSRVEDFLRERRQLGFALGRQDLTLKSFAHYVDRLRWQGPLTVELMADWARRDKWQHKNPTTWARRLKLLRPYARYPSPPNLGRYSRRAREFCRTWPNQQEVTVKGNHYVQEDSPTEIGLALQSFVRGLRS